MVRTDRLGRDACRDCLALHPEFLYVREEGREVVWPRSTLLAYGMSFILGTLFGSFANVCIYRLPQRLSIVFPGSHCPFCQEALRPWHNIPVLSYLMLRGQCAMCKTAISPRYPLIELSNGLLYIFLYHHYHLSVQGIVFALLATALLIVSCIDLVHTIIPDAITLPGIVVGIGTSLWLTPVGVRNAVLGVVLGGGLFLLMAVLSVVILQARRDGGRGHQADCDAGGFPRVARCPRDDFSCRSARGRRGPGLNTFTAQGA